MLADLNAWTNEASFEVLDLQANKNFPASDVSDVSDVSDAGWQACFVSRCLRCLPKSVS